MNKYLAWAVFLVLAASCAGAQPVVDIRFTDSNSARYLEQTGDGIAGGVSPDGKKCLQIDGTVASLALKPIPLKPMQKYKLTIRAAVDGKDTLESNDRILELSRMGGGRSFSSYATTFLDKEGKKTGLVLRGATFDDNSGVIISSKVNDFVHVFYSPPKVAKMRLELRPRKNKLFIESVKLEPENEEGTINCNPDFRYGELNPSGWRPDYDGRLYHRSDGKTIMKSGYSASSPIFPVNDHSIYSFYCKGTSYEAKPGKTPLNFYDKKGVRQGSIHLFWADAMKDGGTKTGVMPPSGTFQAKVVVSQTLFEELRVTKDK